MPSAIETPEHPSEAELPIAKLQRLSLAKLIADDDAASASLFEACSTSGFFALRLDDHAEGEAMLSSADTMFKLAEEFFALETEKKIPYSSPPGKPLLGYKGLGKGKLDSKGTPDRVEIFGISKDDILGQSEPDSALPKPPPISKRADEVREFISRCHRISELVCLHLDRMLGLSEGTLASLQRLEMRSGNQVRLTKTAPQEGHAAVSSLVPHTDLGGVTVLFNRLGGLQILPPGGNAEQDDNWRYVRPETGCAIINLGDAMVEWTNGILRSNMHRVAFPPGKQAGFTRYSIAYFQRPESQVSMRALNQSDMIRAHAHDADVTANPPTAAEWELAKGKALYLGLNKPKSSGGKGAK